MIPEYVDTLIGAAFSADNRYLALYYGNLYPTDYANPVSFVAVYDTAGTRLFVSSEKTNETILGAQFHPDQPNLLLVWGRDFLRIWDWQQATELAAPLYVDHMDGAAFLDETTLGVDDGAGQVFCYRLMGLPRPADRPDPHPAAGRLPSAMTHSLWRKATAFSVTGTP